MNAAPPNMQIFTSKGLITVSHREKPLTGVNVAIKPEFWPQVSMPLTPGEALQVAAALTHYAQSKA